MSKEAVELILQHFGVKGMKWGVRKSNTSGSSKPPSDRAVRKKAHSSDQINRAIHEASRTFAPVAKKIANDPMFKGKDLTANPLLKREYDQVMQTLFNQHLASASINLNVNAKGDRSFAYQMQPNGALRVIAVKAAHDALGDDDPVFPEFKIIYDDKGFFKSIEPVDDLEQSDPVKQFLSHFGVKGMKWGVRKGGGSSSSSQRTRFTKAPSKLSTQELTRRINRMEMEKKYNQLNRHDVSDGRKLVNEVLQSSGRRVATTVLTGASLVAIKAALTSKFGQTVATEATRRLK